VSVLDISFTQ